MFPSIPLSACFYPRIFLSLGWRLIAEQQQPPRGHELLEGCSLDTCSSVRLDYHSFVHALPMPDFKRELHVSTFSANPSDERQGYGEAYGCDDGSPG